MTTKKPRAPKVYLETRMIQPEEIPPCPEHLRELVDAIFERSLSSTPPPPPLVWRPLQPEEVALRERLVEAAREGDLASVQTLYLEVGELPEYFASGARRGALSRAMDAGQLEVCEYLLGQGVDYDYHWVVSIVQKRQLDLMALFLKHGWDINKAYLPAKYFHAIEPPLLGSVVEDEEMVDWFLAHDADPNARCFYDKTPLSYAVLRASFPMIKKLFAHGGSIHAGQLLHYAVFRRKPAAFEILSFLLAKGAPINDVMYQHHEASYNMEVYQPKGTPLHSAAMQGRLDLVQFLMANGANPAIRDAYGLTPLQWAEKEGALSVMTYLQPIVARTPLLDKHFTDGRLAWNWKNHQPVKKQEHHL